MRFTFYTKTSLGIAVQEGCSERCGLVGRAPLEAFAVIPARQEAGVSQGCGRPGVRSGEDLVKGLAMGPERRERRETACR